jgi:ParB family chromosome partitioning protein
MRDLDESKVLELLHSYEQVGVINPISVDEDMVLIADVHRLEAAKNLGWIKIEAKVFNPIAGL